MFIKPFPMIKHVTLCETTGYFWGVFDSIRDLLKQYTKLRSMEIRFENFGYFSYADLKNNVLKSLKPENTLGMRELRFYLPKSTDRLTRDLLDALCCCYPTLRSLDIYARKEQSLAFSLPPATPKPDEQGMNHPWGPSALSELRNLRVDTKSFPFNILVAFPRHNMGKLVNLTISHAFEDIDQVN